MATPVGTSSRQLRRVNVSPDNRTCIICHRDFDTGASSNRHVRSPVRVPCCQQVLCRDCISRWLSPEQAGRSTCPFVSHFKRQAEPSDTNLRSTQCRASLLSPDPQSHTEIENGITPENYLVLRVLREYGYIFARGCIFWSDEQRPDFSNQVPLGHFSHHLDHVYPGFSTSVARRAFTNVSHWHSAPEGRTAATLTRPLREAWSYVRLRDIVSTGMPELQGLLNGLNRHEEEAFFREIERRGAFSYRYFEASRFRRLTNHERWEVLRQMGAAIDFHRHNNDELRIGWFTYQELIAM